MRKSRFTESQIVAILKECEAGVALSELTRKSAPAPRWPPAHRQHDNAPTRPKNAVGNHAIAAGALQDLAVDNNHKATDERADRIDVGDRENASTRGEKNSSTIAQNGALYEKTPTRTRQGKRCGPHFPDGCRFELVERCLKLLGALAFGPEEEKEIGNGVE
jgi:hypothetical protein